MAYRVSQVEIEHKEYDPYIVLNIDRVCATVGCVCATSSSSLSSSLFWSWTQGATDKEVRKQYRELSKTMHPDKGGDPEQFKELIKAYKSLTDDETKRNWELYGNPDGPGGMPGVTIIIVITMALNGFFLLLPSYSFWHSVAQMDGRW